MATPKIGITYPGFVSNIDHLGYKIRLTGFQKKFEGLLYKSCVDKLSSAKLIRGRCVKVEVIAYNGNLLAINLVSIEEEFNEEMNDKKSSKGDQGRKIRIASPDRYQDKIYKPADDDWNKNFVIKPEPSYYKNLNFGAEISRLNLGSNGSKVSINSVVTFPDTFMYKNAKKKNVENGTFHKTWTMHTNWRLGKSLMSAELSQSGSSPADLVQLWSSKHSGKTLKEQRESLPIFKYKNEFIRTLAKNQFVIVQGETGSGKKLNFINDLRLIILFCRQVNTNSAIYP